MFYTWQTDVVLVRVSRRRVRRLCEATTYLKRLNVLKKQRVFKQTRSSTMALLEVYVCRDAFNNCEKISFKQFGRFDRRLLPLTVNARVILGVDWETALAHYSIRV